MPYPLPLLPTSPLSLETMPPSSALAFEMAFMKNTILRSLNALHALAPRMARGDAMLLHFLTYAAKVCDLLAVHLQGDAQFFMHPSLRKILGPTCAPDMSAALGKVAKLRAAVDKWMKQPQDFDGEKLVAALAFGDEVAAKMKTQVMAVDSKRLAAGMKEDELKQMMQANIEWFASQCDIAFLIPFLLSHHDRATSAHWPPITPEGRAALPGLVQQYARCWEMAPFDCVTGKKK